MSLTLLWRWVGLQEVSIGTCCHLDVDAHLLSKSDGAHRLWSESIVVSAL